jgi:hypothetical protein
VDLAPVTGLDAVGRRCPAGFKTFAIADQCLEAGSRG